MQLEQQSLEAGLAEVTALVEQHGYLLAIHSSTETTASAQRLHTIRSILESDRIVPVEVGLPPLGVAVLVRQLRQLSAYDLGPGVIASAVRLLQRYIYAGAVLGTVAKLDRVPVSIKAHVKSWAPGKQYAALANPDPKLIRLGSVDQLPNPEYLTHLAVAPGQLKNDWATRHLAPAWQVQDVEQAVLPKDSPVWWGTSKLVEFAAYIPAGRSLYQMVNHVARVKCHWCGLEVIGDRCVLCSAPAAPPENRSPSDAVM
nr:hypothetical protein [Streptomyces coryli]